MRQKLDKDITTKGNYKSTYFTRIYKEPKQTLLGVFNWCFWTVVLEKTLESHLNCKEIKLVNPKGNQSWIFIERTDAEARAPILWPPDAKNWLIRKDPDSGKDWGGREEDNRGWDGWITSPTRWTWVWASSGSSWWTGKPGMLQSMGSDTTEGLNWTETNISKYNLVIQKIWRVYTTICKLL